MANQIIRKLLGIDRFQELHQHWISAHQTLAKPSYPSSVILIGLTIALFPIIAAYIGDPKLTSYLMTLTVGVSALLAVVYRIRKGLLFALTPEFTKPLRLTHSAFALGCIPALALLLFNPSALTGMSKEDVVVSGAVTTSSFAAILFWIVRVAIWAGITEEIIFRGLLVSLIRRWSIIPSQQWRDIAAVLISAALFALAHYPIWGVQVSLAIFGLGLGLGVAYIAIGELILPLVIYHSVFNTLSLAVAVYLRG